MKTAFEQDRADAYVDFVRVVKQLDTGAVTSGDLFGTREFLKNNYLCRWIATIGIYCNFEARRCIPFIMSMPPGRGPI
jgi:hypothetical protein